MKYSEEQLHQMYPDEEIKMAFLSRDDIKNLAPDEQEKRWSQHKIHLDMFIKQLSGLDALLVG